MNLNVRKLKTLWNGGSPKLPQNSAAVQRFDQVCEWVETLQKTQINIEGENTVLIDQIRIVDTCTKSFGPSKDELLTDNFEQCRANMIGIFSEYPPQIQSLVESCWDLLSGRQDGRVHAEFRIISNIICGKSDLGSLTSHGPARKPNSNFTSNNYFFQIAQFLQDCHRQQQLPLDSLLDKIPIVLSWPNPANFGLPASVEKDDHNRMFQASKDIMNNRFPLKFLWMWANRDCVLPMISLKAMKNFCATDLFLEIRQNLGLAFVNDNPQEFINAPFQKFVKDWKMISDLLRNELGVPLDQLAEVGRLLAHVLLEEPEIKSIQEMLESGNQAVILYGPPGTGKTYEAKKVARMILEREPSHNRQADTETATDAFEARYRFSKLFPALPRSNAFEASAPSRLTGNGCYKIVQFHPGYTYEAFIGGIQPCLDVNGTDLKFVLVPGIFKRFCDVARATHSKSFIFIIDEINRAELSAVFGELLYALEYRCNPVQIPHFGEFSIPKNVYIIGTMNNVDKSLATFDVALRRRFGFYKLQPNLDGLRDFPELGDIQNIDAYIQRCKMLNNDIKNELRLDDEYQIGHAYFMKIVDFLPIATGPETPDTGASDETERRTISFLELEKLWAYHLEPLLEEYLGRSATEVKRDLGTLRAKFVEPLE